MTNTDIDYTFVDSTLNVKANEITCSGVSEDLEKPEGKSISELLYEEKNQA